MSECPSTFECPSSENAAFSQSPPTSPSRFAEESHRSRANGKTRFCINWVATCLVVVVAWLASSALTPQSALAQINLFGNDSFAIPADDPVTIEAKFEPIGDSQQAVLSVTATIGEGYHIYSMTQKGGLPSTVKLSNKTVKIVSGFLPSVAPVNHPPSVFDYSTEEHEGEVTWRAIIEFEGNKSPSERSVEVRYSGLACDSVGCNPYQTKVKAEAAGTIDEIPAELAKLMKVDSGENTVGIGTDSTVEEIEMRPATLPVGSKSITAGSGKLTGWTDKSVYAPGDQGTITIKAELDEGFHTYPVLSAEEQVDGFAPTLISVIEVAGTKSPINEFSIGEAKADREPHRDPKTELLQFEQQVEWTIPFTIPKNLEAGELAIHGVMQSQTCDASVCDMPAQLRWHVGVKIAAEAESGKTDLIWGDSDKSAKTLMLNSDQATAFLDKLLGSSSDGNVLPPTYDGENAFDISVIQPQPFQDSQNFSLPMILAIALLGGFILNFMPCVLPVIGLKILSLVEQAGESRSKALAFNLVYVLGMLSVFWILAILISTKDFGWGSQFSSTLFNVTFAAVVFAMALSYLEVWEITLPSFVGVQSSKLEQKDGWVGTFFKGAVTTILATPCSGPGLATALAWCADKPAWIIFIVFTFLGLGMGLPYILVAFFPPIISFLPKPGPWMNTFKQLMGFVLLGTVAFFMSYVDMEFLFPTICFLMVVWFACWLIGRLNFSSTPSAWFGTWAASMLIVVGSSYFIFGWQVSDKVNTWLGGQFNQQFASKWNLISAQKYRMNSFVDRQINNRRDEKVDEQVADDIKWVPFSLQALEHYTKGENRKTVFIDFTADWCANCKVFERIVLHSEEVAQRLGSEEVIAMIADKTQFNDEIDDLLNQLGAGNQIPLYAVFPKSDPKKPFTLDGTSISISNVNEVLDRSGVPSAATIAKSKPSVDKAPKTSEVAEEGLPSTDMDEDGLPLPSDSIGKSDAVQQVSTSSKSAM